jgi:hypothetical protein
MKVSRIDITDEQHLLDQIAAGWTHLIVRIDEDEEIGLKTYTVLSRSRSWKGALSNREKHKGMGVYAFDLNSLLLAFGSSVRGDTP